MTTQEADLLNTLSQLLDPDAAEERSAEENREFGRSPLQDFTATIHIEGQVTVNKPSWTETHLGITLTDVEVTRHQNYGWAEADNYTITMRIPDSGFKPKADDEAVLFYKGMKKFLPSATLADLDGKRFRFEERHKEYTFKTKKNNYVPETGTRWWYEAVEMIGGNKLVNSAISNGATALPSEAAVEQAMAILMTAGEDGMSISEFVLACSKSKPITSDKALLKQLSENGAKAFIDSMLQAGRILANGDNLVAV